MSVRATIDTLDGSVVVTKGHRVGGSPILMARFGKDIESPAAVPHSLPMAFDTIPWRQWIPRPRFPKDGAPFEHRKLALLAVSMGVFLIALDITIVGVVAPMLSESLGAQASQIQWVFDAFTVVLAGFVVLGGGLAERYGRKGFVQLGMLVFAAGAAISAFAPDPNVLIAGRAISGFGAAFVFPACLSIISALFPPEERPQAIGTFAAISALGLAGGPLVGGILIQWFWWGAAFLVFVPVALLSIVAIGGIVPPSHRLQDGPIDVLGALLSIIGLGGVVFGVIEGPERGWGESVVLVPFAIGLLCIVSFVVWELRCQAPLFDLRVFNNSRVVGGAIAMALVYFTLNSIQLLVPQYLSYVRNLSSVQIGLMMCPLGVALVTLSPRSSGLVDRHGQRAMLMVSLVLMAGGLGVLALLPFWGGLSNVLAGLCVFGAGFGMIVAPATAAIMVAIPKDKAGDGSAVNMVSRQIGGAMGVAILGSLAAVIYRNRLSFSGLSLTASQQISVERSLSGVIALREELESKMAARLDAMADTAMVEGVAMAMASAAAVTLIVAGVAFVALRKRPLPPNRRG